MTKEDVSVTYENNIFYCTKDNTKWISIDGENWYVEEKRLEELKKENNKLLDVINNQDVKIADLEKENARLNRLSDTQDKTIVDLTETCKQLTKAKEIIRRFMDIIKQFLKEE